MFNTISDINFFEHFLFEVFLSQLSNSLKSVKKTILKNSDG